MFVTIQKSTLAGAVSKVARMVAKGNTIPILNCIKVSATDESVILVGGNTEHSIEISIPVDQENGVIVEKSGNIVLPYLFYDIVRKMEGDIVIQTNELIATIKAGKAKFELNGLDAEEYPSHAKKDGEEKSFSLTGEELQTLIKKTGYCASKSAERPILQGVYIEIEQKKLRFNATDAHRLGIGKIALNDEIEDNLGIVVHHDSLSELVRVLDEKDMVKITLTDHLFIAETEGVIFRSRLLDGNFPDVNRVLPTKFSTKLSLNRAEFLTALERLSVLAGGKVAKLTVKETDVGQVVELVANEKERGSAHETMFVGEYEGEPLKIAFNVVYAIEALKAIDDQEVMLSFTGEFSPFTITPMNGGENELHLILPLRLN